MGLDTTRCVVLNATYEPITIVSSKRALILFLEDQYTCQYCGRNKQQLKSSEFLTRDHVMPRHMGGRDIWENVVTCCNSCNNKKAYHLLEDINMPLLKIPTAPTIFELWTRQQKRFQQH